jgi:uncharacterized protein (DUF1501 family)
MSFLAKFGAMNSLAQSASSGYQALVCIYMNGGNDGHNCVIPVSTTQQNYSQYAKSRGPVALAQNVLKLVQNGSDTYGLHPSLVEIQGLYNQGKAAILANVGNLLQPVTRSALNSSNSQAIVPAALFSHSDQSNQWQSAMPNSFASTGWGGRAADLLQSQNTGAIFPPVTSINNCGLFCTGKETFPATVPPPWGNSSELTGMSTLNGIQNSPATDAALQQLLTFDNGLQLVQAGNGVLSRGQNYANTITSLLKTSTLTTTFPANNPLALQLQTVANLMSIRTELGLTRQVFFCQLGGFDTHSDQHATQELILKQVSQAVLAFYQATQEMGISQNVTTFTTSEFGRTLNPSGNNGSDHAWGSHHFVIGGGVQGGQIYGTFPSLVLGGDDDANTRGTLIPTTSIAQYGATLAQWFGVGASDLPTVFPTIGNFTSSNLGFMG